MSRGQWVDYESFNLIELIDELKTRIEEPFRANDTLHGIMVSKKDYDTVCAELRDFLVEDDKKANN